LPVVSSTLSNVSFYYLSAKERNDYIKAGLDTVERSTSATLQAINTHPMIALRLETLDALGQSQLDNLEKRFPLITKPTNVVLQTSKETIDSYMAPALRLISNSRTHSSRAQQQLQQKALENLQFAKVRSQEAVDKMRAYSVDLVQYARQMDENRVDAVLSALEKTQNIAFDAVRTAQSRITESATAARNVNISDVAERAQKSFQDVQELVNEYAKQLRAYISQVRGSGSSNEQIRVLVQGVNQAWEQARESVSVYAQSLMGMPAVEKSGNGYNL